MTQGEIARRAAVSPQALSRLLAVGNADVTLSIACRLAWALGKSVNEFEEAVFEEWNMQPHVSELLDREMTRGRLRRKLNAMQARIEAWDKQASTCDTNPGGVIMRRWLEGINRHWRGQAEQLAKRLRELG